MDDEKIRSTTELMMRNRTYQQLIPTPFSEDVKDETSYGKKDILPVLLRDSIWMADQKTDRPEEGRCLVINTYLRMGVDVVRVLVTFMRDNNIANCVYVCPQNPTGPALTSISNAKELFIQVFTKTALVVPYPQHYLAPQFIARISKEEAKSIVAMKNGQDNGHTVSIDDPLIRWYGWRVNDFVMTIIRRFSLPPAVSVDVVVAATL
jgi:hypothetical protein